MRNKRIRITAEKTSVFFTIVACDLFAEKAINAIIIHSRVCSEICRNIVILYFFQFVFRLLKAFVDNSFCCRILFYHIF